MQQSGRLLTTKGGEAPRWYIPLRTVPNYALSMGRRFYCFRLSATAQPLLLHSTHRTHLQHQNFAHIPSSPIPSLFLSVPFDSLLPPPAIYEEHRISVYSSTAINFVLNLIHLIAVQTTQLQSSTSGKPFSLVPTLRLLSSKMRRLDRCSTQGCVLRGMRKTAHLEDSICGISSALICMGSSVLGTSVSICRQISASIRKK